MYAPPDKVQKKGRCPRSSAVIGNGAGQNGGTMTPLHVRARELAASPAAGPRRSHRDTSVVS